MSSGKLTNSTSPQGYYQLFNKMVSEQQGYNRSDNPEMFAWRQKFQPLEQYVIPQMFKTGNLMREKTIAKAKRDHYTLPNNETSHYIRQVDDQPTHMNIKEDYQQLKHYKKQKLINDMIVNRLDTKINNFKGIENKIESVNIEQKRMKMHNLHKQLSDPDSPKSRQFKFRNGTGKSGSMFQDLMLDTDNKQEIVNRIKQFPSAHTSRSIKPIYNHNILIPLSDQSCQIKKSITFRAPRSSFNESSQKQSISRLDTNFVTNRQTKFRTCETFIPKHSREPTIKFKPFDVEDINQGPKTKYSIKNAKQVSSLIQYISQTYAEQSKSVQHKESITDFKIHDKLSQHFNSLQTENSDGTRKHNRSKDGKLSVTDQKRFFLDFPTYFFQNYQIFNNGLSSTLPQQILVNNENFEQGLEKLISQMDN